MLIPIQGDNANLDQDRKWEINPLVHVRVDT